MLHTGSVRIGEQAECELCALPKWGSNRMEQGAPHPTVLCSFTSCNRPVSAPAVAQGICEQAGILGNVLSSGSGEQHRRSHWSLLLMGRRPPATDRRRGRGEGDTVLASYTCASDWPCHAAQHRLPPELEIAMTT